jgi:o-succinylbenzoate---CoA ligase
MRPLLAAVPDVDRVRAALDGSGPALLTDPAAPLSGPVDDEVCAVVPTSGSTGAPRGVELTAACLTASARATAEVVGEGQWLLAIPPTHVGGLQVLVRSVLAGTPPVVLRGPTTVGSFDEAAARLTGPARLVSLVPTQLRRLLGSPALRSFDAVLLGGAAAPASLVDAARADGVRVVTTYGMTETSGGCVYDGVPLPGVELEVGERIVVRGPVVARGVLGGERFDGQVRTNDVGEWRGGRLVVLGRADDVVVTGGAKVAPAAVEDRLRTHPSVVDVAVVGVPDEEWGQRVRAVVVLRGPLTLEEARDHVSGPLPRAAAPRELQAVDALPLLPSGKIDRMGLRG